MPRTKQLKISVDPAIADAFKTTCISDGISMTSALSAFMQSAIGENKNFTQAQSKQFSTRGKRRTATLNVLSTLSEIRDAEEAYRDNIPENLRGGVRYECADNSIELLEQAIALIEDAF
jgi:phage portal protein BeeE